MTKSAIVTGAASGIGLATAFRLRDSGFEVYAVDKNTPGASHERMTFINCDVADEGSVNSLITTLAGQIDSLDVLVNNAAIQIAKPLVKISMQEWDEQMSVNAGSVFLMTRAAHRLLRKPGGSIVNVSTVHTKATSKSMASYAATKGAMDAMTRALALELSADGIRVNAVLPGAVDTPMLRKSMERGGLEGGGVEEKLAVLASKTPLKRVARPEEIAEAILFLADESRSSFITGASLVIDGGVLARLSTE